MMQVSALQGQSSSWAGTGDVTASHNVYRHARARARADAFGL